MTPTPVFYELLVRGDESGALAGMHLIEHTIYRDESGDVLFERIGDAQPLPADGERLAALLPALNAQALAQVQSLTAQLATAKTETTAAQEDATAKGAEVVRLTATIEELRAQIAGASTVGTDPTEGLLANLNATFDAAIPEALRAQFAPVYAIVRALVQAGRMDLARGVIEGTAVPEDLTAAKAQILAALA